MSPTTPAPLPMPAEIEDALNAALRAPTYDRVDTLRTAILAALAQAVVGERERIASVFANEPANGKYTASRIAKIVRTPPQSGREVQS